jgi:uncharacterized protein with PQ loop repeat
MLEFYRLFGGFIISLSLIPQIYHTYKYKRVDDISYYWQSSYIIGLGLSLVYELYYNLWMMYLPTSFEAFCMIILTTMKYKYSKVALDKEVLPEIEMMNTV